MQVPWIEHWDFLDSYVDLSTAEGLDTLEEYFKKTVWHRFIKEFKDMHDLEELYQDFTGLSTPIEAESCDIENAENNGKDFIETDQKSTDGFKKDLNVSKDLSKIFNICMPDTNGDVCEIQKDKDNDKVGDAAAEDLTDASKSAMSKADSNQNGAGTDDILSTSASFKTSDVSSPKDVNVGQSANVIVSPVTGLSQSFAQLTVHDESWDDKVNSNNTDSAELCDSAGTSNGTENDNVTVESEDNDNQIGDKENNVDTGRRKEETTDNKTIDGVAVQDISENNRLNLGERKSDSKINEDQSKTETVNLGGVDKSINSAEKDQTTVSDIIKDTADKKSKDKLDTTDGQLNTENVVGDVAIKITAAVVDCVKENADQNSDTKDKIDKTVKADDSQPVSPDNQISAVGRQHLLSERSDSTGSTSSYKTVDSEAFYDCSVLSPFSDTTAVGIRLMYKPILDTLKEEIDRRSEHFSELDTEPVLLLVRLKKFPGNGVLTVDIVLYPTNNSMNQLLLFENLEVKSCEGDLSGALEGEVIEVVFTQKLIEVKLKAHFTREENLPQPLYIHG